MGERDSGAAFGSLGGYELLELIGRGASGQVYRARDPALGREVAIKVLDPALAAKPSRRQRFLREARLASRLEHPNIARIYAVGRSGNRDFIALELVRGPTLRERLRAGPLAGAAVIAIGRQLAGALEAAHALGIIHRDLKPENMREAHDGSLKILDFGLARVEEQAGDAIGEISSVQTSWPGALTGTLAYLAPELLDGERASDKSDLFSAGVVLYELLSGTNPFRRLSIAHTLSALQRCAPPELRARPEVPAALAELIHALLSADPKRRPAARQARLRLEQLEQSDARGTRWLPWRR
ncbi:MAG TPA: serine/threonine-protein kinase [Acidobacteriota bacterium]